jgi:hypothetical protein
MTAQLQRPRFISYNLVWDIVTLAWVEMTQPGGVGGGGDASAANQLLGNASLTSLVTEVGAVLEAAPITDTGSSGLNGRLQRIAQRLTSLITAIGSPFQAGGSIGNSAFGATQSGTWTVQPGNTANSTAWKVDGSAVTQPVSFAQQALPANQSVNVAQVAGVAPSLNTGVRDAGTRRVTIATNDVVPVSGTFWQATQPVSGTFWQATQPVSGTFFQATQPVSFTPPTLTKGTQGATGYSTQDLKDAGRNVTNYFMAAGVAGTNAEVMQSLTGYKSGAAVGATATPAVVTAGKTYRVTSITLSYQSLATAGACLFRLRANLSGTGVIGSPLVMTFTVGSLAAVAGVTNTLDIPFPDGLEFAAGTGIAVGMLGLSTVGAALAAGFGTITIYGYEY